MQQMILPSTPITPENYHNFMEKGSFDAFKQKNGLTTDIIPGNRLYLSTGMCKGPAISHTDLKMLGPEQSKKIKTMIDTYGEDVTMALADLFAHPGDSISKTLTVPNTLTVVGGAQGYVDTKVGLLKKKMDELSELMVEHNRKLRENIDIYSIRQREIQIESKVIELKNRFHSDLKSFIAKRKLMKKSPFTNPKIEKEMAKSSRKTGSFFVENRTDFKKLINLIRYVKILGVGLIAIDIGYRIYNGIKNLKNAKTREQSIKAGRDLTGSLVQGVSSAGIAYAGFTVLGTMAAGIAIGGPLLVFTLAVGTIAVVAGSGYLSEKIGESSKSFYDAIIDFFEKTNTGDKVDAFAHG
ncbi:hypothetical protein MSP8886_00328 [Marinomonas spartinae]|uniref:Uncharacterized protein n=1 Tax=Marinomonas spartinae TaxID=1792290 RepID=A0A1A8T1Q5_9GAMM|nr:hypothetical protein [Marinomonas spartinae]SBS25611.1 hypothetical protein MSP8886_00328 [Marinomonas spartinae]